MFAVYICNMVICPFYHFALLYFNCKQTIIATFFCPNFKEEVGRAYCFGHVRPSTRSSVHHAFAISHIFETMYFRILKLHICIAYDKLADPYCFSFLSDSSWWSYGHFSD